MLGTAEPVGVAGGAPCTFPPWKLAFLRALEVTQWLCFSHETRSRSFSFNISWYMGSDSSDMVADLTRPNPRARVSLDIPQPKAKKLAAGMVAEAGWGVDGDFRLLDGEIRRPATPKKNVSLEKSLEFLEFSQGDSKRRFFSSQHL